MSNGILSKLYRNLSRLAKLTVSEFGIGSSTLMTDIKDEDNMSSNSNTSLATQQSIKAYVDNSKPTRAVSSEITVLTGDQNYTFAHGLGEVPDEISAYLICKTIDLGYAVGDVVKITDIAESSSGSYIYSNATNVVYLQDNGIGINNHSGGRSFITYANWKLILTATIFN